MATASKPPAKEPARKPITPIEVQHSISPREDKPPPEIEHPIPDEPPPEHEIHEGSTDGRFLGRWRREVGPVIDDRFQRPWWAGHSVSLYREPPPLVRAPVRNWSMSGNS